ncbi:CPLN2 protein, partial [Mesembrinibis cayennensis]|nr:CPLN2 protein [Mesembrinibis cayennensis]
PGWLLSPAGRPHLDSIFQKNQRRVFGEPHIPPSIKWGASPPKKPHTSPPGLLERPVLSPALAVPTVTYKLFLSGKSGVGKTALVAALAGTPVPPLHHETLGIEATTVYWPAKLRASGRPVIFQLHFWD